MGFFYYTFTGLIHTVALAISFILMFLPGEIPTNTAPDLDHHYAQSITASKTIELVRDSLNRIKPFRVNFIQQVYTDEQLDIEESGEIIFKNDRLLKWMYLEPDYKVFILEENNYQFYDEDNEQLIIGKIKDRSQLWIWQLVFSNDTSRYYHVTRDKNHKKIRIRHNPDTNSGDAPDINNDIEIIINDGYLPIQVIQKDPSGARIVYMFEEYKSKIKIPGDAFRLNVPENVEIIRE